MKEKESNETTEQRKKKILNGIRVVDKANEYLIFSLTATGGTSKV
jgi:hypothetical protein